MIDLENTTRSDPDLDLLQNIADSLTKKDIEVVICPDRRIRELNALYRGRDKATDVLSFPLKHNDHLPLGTIVISADTAQAAADAHGHGFSEEIALLFIHGLLHLLGFDHEADSGQMRQEEAKLIEHFGLPSSLLVRNG